MSVSQFAVIGHPIGHTMSPFIHNRLFELDRFSAAYSVLDIAPESLRENFAQLKNLSGFNITIPHKQAIIPFLDELDEQARYFHSVNTVKNTNGFLKGYTTDGTGFTKALQSAGIPLTGRILILGAGGVARVMGFEAIAASNQPNVTIAVREHSLSKAKKLCADLENTLIQRGCKIFSISCCSFNELPGKSFDLLVNGTPSGMYPHTESCPIDSSVINNCSAVFDAIYNPEETLLLKLAAQNGAMTLGGMSMLVWQAAAAHEIWNGASYRQEEIEQLCLDASVEMRRIF